MDRYDRTAQQYLALPTAAALVYYEITGNQLDGKLEPQTRNILCDVAHALSVLAPIYVVNGSPETLSEVPPATLMGATFERGAHVLVMQDGTELRNLTIQRGDMKSAVQILRECDFRRRWGVAY
jgi:hypothetical protein